MNDDEKFELVNDKPKSKQVKFEPPDRHQQVLFSGLDCLPGQQDLFQVDGTEEDDNV